MSTQKQMTFWDEPVTEQKIIWMEMADLKTKQNNLRKGLFQRFDDLQKELELLRNQLVLLNIQKLES